MYDTIGMHRAMLRDDARNRAFRDGLRAHIRPGSVVLDVGAGTGILSMFAAQAGAARVYAVERTGIAHAARRLIARNGFQDRIHVIESDIEAVRLPEPVDLIVSEWLGTIGVDENMLSAVVTARDRWLKPGGVMLPEKVVALAAPAHLPELDQDLEFWPSRPYGLDLSLIGEAVGQEYTWTPAHNGEGPHLTLLAEGETMWSTNAATVSLHQARLPSRTALSFEVKRGGRCNGIVAWFTAEFGGGVSLSTAPEAAQTHWRQYVYPFYRGIDVEPGSTINVEVTCLPMVPGYSHQAWSMRIDNGPWEHHDTRRVVWRE